MTSLYQPDLRGFRHRLVESLRLLASNFEIQTSVLPDFVCVPCEVVLTFSEDAFLLADQVLGAGLITDEQFSRMEEVDRYIDRMSDRKELWTPDAMKHSPEWDALRRMARDVLRLLGAELQRPKLDWISFVGSRPLREGESGTEGIEFDSDSR